MNQGIYGVGTAATIANMPYGVNGIPLPFIISVLLVGGGGPSGFGAYDGTGGGGGGGGFIETLFAIEVAKQYLITVGAGGATGGLNTYGLSLIHISEPTRPY